MSSETLPDARRREGVAWGVTWGEGVAVAALDQPDAPTEFLAATAQSNLSYNVLMQCLVTACSTT